VYVVGGSHIAALTKEDIASSVEETFNAFSLDKQNWSGFLPPAQELADQLWINRGDIIKQACIYAKLPLAKNEEEQAKTLLAFAKTGTEALSLIPQNIPQVKANKNVLDYCTEKREKYQKNRHRQFGFLSGILHLKAN